MKVICGWASKSEKGTANGAKGDQTTNEIKTGLYYNFGQDKIIRFKNSSRGVRAGKAIEKLCNNNNIGYGQSDRKTLYNECDRIGWDIKRVNEIRLCNGDCSELVACAINFAYGKQVIPWNCTTRDIEHYTVGNKPKCFRIIRSIDEKKLKAGDIVLKAGKHVIMVIKTVY